MILKTRKFSVYAGGLNDNRHDSDNSGHCNDVAVRDYAITSISDYGSVRTISDVNDDEHYKYLKLTFTKLYHGISYLDTCNASLMERRAEKAKYSSVLPYTLTYGEINDMDCMRRIFLFLRSTDLLPKRGIFYDLGSGIGRPVFGASLLHSFDKCIGIELLSSLHSISMEVLNKWTDCIRDDDKLRSFAYSYAQQVNFIQGSILDSSTIDWTDGDIVFANSTCFDNIMMQTLLEISATMKIGSIFITLSQPLILTAPVIVSDKLNEILVEEVACWRVIGVSREAMSW